MKIKTKILDSGYLHVSFSDGGWAQIPPAYYEETVDDRYIFNPAYNRNKVNLWWKGLLISDEDVICDTLFIRKSKEFMSEKEG